jgi:signal transduction histidine kinase
VIRDAVESAPSRHRSVQVHLPSDPLIARCDAGRLEQVVENLVGNAVKYSPADTEVEVDAWRDEERVVIAVRDRGAGMSEDQQRQLFAPFGRLGGSGVPGTGLGLYVSRGIVVAHGGTITVASAPGRGSTFRVEIPVA